MKKNIIMKAIDLTIEFNVYGTSKKSLLIVQLEECLSLIV